MDYGGIAIIVMLVIGVSILGIILAIVGIIKIVLTAKKVKREEPNKGYAAPIVMIVVGLFFATPLLNYAYNIGYNKVYHAKHVKTLEYAVREDNIERVRELLEKGADPNEKGYWYTPLEQAARNGNTQMMRLLLKHGAAPDPSLVNFDTAQMFFEFGVKPNDVLSRNMQYVGVEFLELLLNNGADINLTCDKGETALMKTRDHKKIEFLLKRGADINHISDEGKTVLDIWLERWEEAVNSPRHSTGEFQIAEMLLLHGAKRAPPIVDDEYIKGIADAFYEFVQSRNVDNSYKVAFLNRVADGFMSGIFVDGFVILNGPEHILDTVCVYSHGYVGNRSKTLHSVLKHKSTGDYIRTINSDSFDIPRVYDINYLNRIWMYNVATPSIILKYYEDVELDWYEFEVDFSREDFRRIFREYF